MAADDDGVEVPASQAAAPAKKRRSAAKRRESRSEEATDADVEEISDDDDAGEPHTSATACSPGLLPRRLNSCRCFRFCTATHTVTMYQLLVRESCST